MAGFEDAVQELSQAPLPQLRCRSSWTSGSASLVSSSLRVRSTTDGALELSGTGISSPLTRPNAITDGSPPIGELSFGAHFAAANVVVDQPALDVWVDDVIVHSAPVTCDD